MRGVLVVGDEARADRDVARVRVHALEQTPQLVRRVLPVRVDAAAVRVVVVACPCVAGGDRSLQAAVLAERDHFGAAGAGHVRRPVGRAVVHDEHVDVGQLGWSSLRTAGRFCASFQAGMKTSVSASG